jgi:hypothetical protein
MNKQKSTEHKVSKSTLTANQRTSLAKLAARGKEWSRPRDLGGESNSHHSRSLARLWWLKLAERRSRTVTRDEHDALRPSYEYRITAHGARQAGAPR